MADQHGPPVRGGPPEGWEAPRERWLSTVVRPAFGPRSVLLEVVARLLIPSILTFAVFLLVTGHDRPGGGFAAGLVAGMAYVLRYVAGGRQELAAGLPTRPQGLLAIGLLATAGTATAPLLWGDPILRTFSYTADLPVFGKVKFASYLLFELGVVFIVVGLVLAVVAALGARMEAEEEEARALSALRRRRRAPSGGAVEPRTDPGRPTTEGRNETP
ncbi:multisubunit Na+/H+ antiporter MnhB subunit [Nocardiopsis mwathae]|uniref:Multisubunit Na+/H+ antiporter MnhB subunit n=1 Tax=Nocardiopsis mwathae TaxID=1472723 RepID=A0A7W9YIF0_9ACTN|nr:MnhB domain-containing protein [Nocardiopsis mwathae]MBB6172750.1 multisubunit Na+/H+ antiporter MnhB subunit [Nocardiopsis mwathae]